MAWALANVRYLAALAVLLAAFMGGWHVGAGRVERRWDADKQVQAKAEADLRATTVAKTAELQAKADQLEKDRDQARTDLDSYRAAHPVHVRLCSAPSGGGGGLSQGTGPEPAGPTASPVVQPPLERDVGPELDQLAADADAVTELYRKCKAGYEAVSQ